MPASPYADGRLADERRPAAREVQCARCAAVVLAAKFSPQQTSVQWTADAVRGCAEFAARVAGGRADRAHRRLRQPAGQHRGGGPGRPPAGRLTRA